MKRVGAGFEGCADDAAHEVAEFRRRVVSDQVEFFDRVGRRRITQQVVRNLVVVHAVEDEVIRLFAVAVDKWPRAARNVVAIVEAARVGMNRARRQQRQFDVVARSQRKRLVGRPIDDRVNLRSFGLQNGSAGSHFHGVGYLSDFQLDIYACNLIEC